MKFNQSTLSIGNGGNVLIDTTNITPKDRQNLKQNWEKSSSGKKKKLPFEKRKDNIYQDVCTPKKKESPDSLCPTILEEHEEEFFTVCITSDQWETVAEERRIKLAPLLEENKELAEQVETLEEIFKQTKELAAFLQPIVEELTLEKEVEGCAKETHQSLIKTKSSPPAPKAKKESNDKENLKHPGLPSNKKQSSSKKSKNKSSSSKSFTSDEIYVDESPALVNCNIISAKNTPAQRKKDVTEQKVGKHVITAEMLSGESTSPMYWECLATKRLAAIEETEAENSKLRDYIISLEEMCSEAKELALLLQSVVDDGSLS